MATNPTNDIRDQWTRLSPGWEEQRAYLLETSRPVHAWLVDKLQPADGETILEIGAATGDTGFLAAPGLGPNGKLVSTDLSPAMVEVARRRAAELGIRNAEFQAVDAQAMPFPDASFDGIICRWTYMLLPDPAAGLRETRRVLKPNGRLVLAVFTGPSENMWASLPSRLLVQGGHLPPPAPGTPGILALADRGRLEALLRDAGFNRLEIEAVSFQWRFPDLEAYWTFLTELTVLGPAIQRLSAPAQEGLRQKVSEQLQPFREGDRVSFPAQCWMVSAR
jgi:SAM-dependent methyltransferase